MSADGQVRGSEPVTGLQQGLLDWFSVQGRDLPWRRTQDPYRVLVAEVMLQQTGVSRILGRYEAFLARFPTLEALARAPTAEVIRAWAPLGYNRRAVNLQRAVRLILAEHGGVVPQDPAVLRRLPGVGPYTAAAIACFAFGRDVAVVDTNVRRVLGRLLVGPAPVSLGEAWRLAEVSVPSGEASAWGQALMDLGATICLAARPRCDACPVQAACIAAPIFQTSAPRLRVDRVAERRTEVYWGSARYYRGRLLQALREAPGPLPFADLGARVQPGYGSQEESWLLGLLAGLEQDGLIRMEGSMASLP